MLYLVATPIGNLGDLSPRALETLRAAPVVAAEDTRRTWQLLSHFGIPRPARMVSYREGAEERAGAQILECLRAGEDVALCTDAGYPGVSDPGFRLVRDVVAAGLPVTVLPGPSAADVALVLSGLPTSSWTFLGFPPRKPGALRRFFGDEARSPHTLVLYESPFRVGKTLAAAAEVLGARPAAVCLELTKMHERVERGTLPELAAKFAGEPPKGEIAIVIGGLTRAERNAAADDDGEA
jgi:16S rRNA (cytidine1402-2'-O)-methyltransferase